MLLVERANQFKKDYKLAKRRGKDLALLNTLIKKIANHEAIEAKHREHHLSGNWRGYKELHIENDWLLIYQLIPHKKRSFLCAQVLIQIYFVKFSTSLIFSEHR